VDKDDRIVSMTMSVLSLLILELGGPLDIAFSAAVCKAHVSDSSSGVGRELALAIKV